MSDGTNTYLADELTTGLLANATSLTLTGEWSDAQIQKFKAALKSDSSSNTKNTTLQTVDMSAVTFSGNTLSFENMFLNCTALTSVILPEKEVTQPVDFRSTFYGCSQLATVTNLDKFSNVSDFSEAFGECYALTSVKLGCLVTEYQQYRTNCKKVG